MGIVISIPMEISLFIVGFFPHLYVHKRGCRTLEDERLWQVNDYGEGYGISVNDDVSCNVAVMSSMSKWYRFFWGWTGIVYLPYWEKTEKKAYKAYVNAKQK